MFNQIKMSVQIQQALGTLKKRYPDINWEADKDNPRYITGLTGDIQIPGGRYPAGCGFNVIVPSDESGSFWRLEVNDSRPTPVGKLYSGSDSSLEGLLHRFEVSMMTTVLEISPFLPKLSVTTK